MTKRVAWGITGSGAFLKESVEAIETLMRKGFKITAFVSRAGESVLKFYGLQKQLESVLTGDYPVGVVYESEQPPGFPVTGRLYLGVYDIVVVSPASMNTVSKIIHGIADSLVSNLAMHAIKSNTPIVILPVDAVETKSIVPMVIDRDKCSMCTDCIAAKACIHNALAYDKYHKVKTYPERCQRCYSCLEACPHNAIRFDVEIVVKPVRFYLELINRLKFIDNLRLALSVREILEIIGDQF